MALLTNEIIDIPLPAVTLEQLIIKYALNLTWELSDSELFLKDEDEPEWDEDETQSTLNVISTLESMEHVFWSRVFVNTEEGRKEVIEALVLEAPSFFGDTDREVLDAAIDNAEMFDLDVDAQDEDEHEELQVDDSDDPEDLIIQE